uniref:Uncharacterized protein n=1 Tax=Vitis vinifera TaxID=29760 RepID=F6GYC0_VITVI
MDPWLERVTSLERVCDILIFEGMEYTCSAETSLCVYSVGCQGYMNCCWTMAHSASLLMVESMPSVGIDLNR